MIRIVRKAPSTAILVLALLHSPMAGRAEDAGPGKQPTPSRKSVDASKVPKSGPVVYVPKSRGRSKTRSGAGTRGAAALPAASVIAPEHDGFTTRAQPTLYWFISEATDLRIDFTVIDDVSDQPLIEVTLNGPVARGLHALRLADFGLSLEPEKAYIWYVSLIPDPRQRSADIVSGATVRRSAATPALEAALLTEPAWAAYARNGYWYDSISALNEEIENDPTDTALLDQRTAFFEQVGLEDVARLSGE